MMKPIVPWKCHNCGREFDMMGGGICKKCGRLTKTKVSPRLCRGDSQRFDRVMQ